MKNYKSVLKISIKPERVVAYYLIVISFLGVALIICLVLINPYVLLSLFPMVFLFRLKWQKYYCLQQTDSIVGLTLGDDELFVEYRNGEAHKVILTDQLHINQWMLFVFSKFPSKSTNITIQRVGFFMTLKSNIYDFIARICRELIYFLSYRKIIVVISEKSIGVSAYRELLRRSDSK